MIQIERHIEILLLNNDCVIVPDFGGFMAHRVEARYDEAESLFLPPLRTLGFNAQLRLNDSLLAQSYIEAYDISYPEALRRIADEVDELKQHLSEHGHYELNDIGTISLNENGQYEFAPCEAGILTPSLYALSTFEMPPIAQRSEKAAIAPMRKTDANESPALLVVDDEEAPEARTISIKVSTLRNLAAACIAVLVVLLFPHQIGLSGEQAPRELQASSEILQHLMPRDLTMGKPHTIAPAKASAVTEARDATEAQAGNAMKAEAATAEKPSPEPVGTQEKAEAVVAQPYFTIVLASQVGKKNGETFASQLRQQGFPLAEVVSASKGMRVIYGRYANESEAYNALRPLRGQSEAFGEGWILEIKP